MVIKRKLRENSATLERRPSIFTQENWGGRGEKRRKTFPQTILIKKDTKTPTFTQKYKFEIINSTSVCVR